MSMNIAILGAGVAGLSTAIALTQKGFTVDIYERSGVQHHQQGAGIICWPNATFVLHELGLLNDIARVSGQPTHMQRISSQGEPLGSIDILQLNQLMGYPSFSILRKDLMNILKLHAKQLRINIHYKHAVQTLSRTNSGKTRISLSTGNITQADLVIGADGRMNSAARTFVNGDNSPVYQGFINWVGVFESAKPTFRDLSIHDYWGTGERFGLVPISPYKAYWAGAISASKIEKSQPNHYRKALLSIFKNWPGHIRDIIANTPAGHIHQIFVHDHNPIDTWHKDNVLLIGDAAHAPLPTSGQGACQALEDAWHLSQILATNQDNIETALKIFTDIRRTKTTNITLGARQLAASLFNNDPMFCQQRNQQSKITNYTAMIEGMAKGWASQLPMYN